MLNRTQINGKVRIIAALLLATIAWASTVEFTHHHSGRSNNTLAGSMLAAQTNLSGHDAANLAIESGQPARSSSRTNTASECLICQLHHNLATTLLSEPASVAAAQTISAHAALPDRIHLLGFTAAQSGRAPPVSFLS